MFWHLQEQVGIIACLVYSASDTFLRVSRINKYRDTIKNKKNKTHKELAKYQKMPQIAFFIFLFN